MSPLRALVHFLLLGGALFAAVRLLELPLPNGPPPPAAAAPAPMDDEAILVAEARRLGLHEDDPVIRERLVRNLRFLGEPGDDDALHRRALGLGMDETDPVVRRRLALRMRARLEAPARGREPTDAELRAYLEAHPERFARPRRVAFEHVFFDAARRRDAAGDARAARRGTGPDSIPGDPFLAPRTQPLQTELSLARSFGAPFAAALFELPAEGWQGPIPSVGGVHLVRIRERRAAELPALGEVRAALREGLLDERAEAAAQAFLSAQRGGEPVR